MGRGLPPGYTGKSDRQTPHCHTVLSLHLLQLIHQLLFPGHISLWNPLQILQQGNLVMEQQFVQGLHRRNLRPIRRGPHIQFHIQRQLPQNGKVKERQLLLPEAGLYWG